MRNLRPNLGGAALVGLALASLALAGCAGPDTPAVSSGPTASSKASSVPPAVGDVKEFHVDVTETGFKEQQGRELTAKKGDQVKIVLHHAEPYGDDHPIYFTCTERSATVTQTGGSASMEFVADSAGACSFFCTNHDCGPHEALQSGKLIVQE